MRYLINCEELEKLASDEELIGHALGNPIWLQDDATPDCCQQLMEFKLQLYGAGEINFGGGIGYLFQCAQCKDGKFFWQR